MHVPAGRVKREEAGGGEGEVVKKAIGRIKKQRLQNAKSAVRSTLYALCVRARARVFSSFSSFSLLTSRSLARARARGCVRGAALYFGSV